jgi:hypothetical protein
MPLKTCRNCGIPNGPRAFYCGSCDEPFTATIAKSRVASQPKTQLAYAVSQPRTSVAATPIPTLRPDAFSDKVGLLNLDPKGQFDDLYGKTDALSVIMASLAVYNQTQGRNRYHSLLVGGPSAGKSEIANRIQNVVGPDNVLRINSESASKAGMENEILGCPQLPPVLIVEEIEKIGDPQTLLWMLPALDTRQEIIKVTAKDGILRRKVPFVCIGTCNNLSKLERMHSGAIASRFTNKLFIPDMNDDMRYEILKTKIRILPNANEAWIPKAIDYCREIGDLSMRRIESVLMCGQDRLLTGEYQASLAATQRV